MDLEEVPGRPAFTICVRRSKIHKAQIRTPANRTAAVISGPNFRIIFTLANIYFFSSWATFLVISHATTAKPATAKPAMTSSNHGGKPLRGIRLEGTAVEAIGGAGGLGKGFAEFAPGSTAWPGRLS